MRDNLTPRKPAPDQRAAPPASQPEWDGRAEQDRQDRRAEQDRQAERDRQAAREWQVAQDRRDQRRPAPQLHHEEPPQAHRGDVTPGADRQGAAVAARAIEEDRNGNSAGHAMPGDHGEAREAGGRVAREGSAAANEQAAGANAWRAGPSRSPRGRGR